MSVARSSKDMKHFMSEGFDPAYWSTDDKDCFYCGEHMQGSIGVYWMGHLQSIYLHPNCFHRLFIRLARDVHQIECEPISESEIVEKTQKQKYHDYLKSEEWQEKRRAKLLQAGNRCQVCNGDKSLHVHHRTYERCGNELPGDLTVLCSECHAMYHKKLPGGDSAS